MFFNKFNFCLAAALISVAASAQMPFQMKPKEPEVLPVPVRKAAPKSEEKVIDFGGGKIITGVSEPTITVYLPQENNNTGTAVILLPGGGMRMLSWSNDVERMAKVLNAQGIAAIGLKYRLNNSTAAPAQQAGPAPKMIDVTEYQKFAKANANPSPGVGEEANDNAIEDARNAVKLVREHAADWKIDPEKVGFLGFSAGGCVAIGATIRAQEGEMPNFLCTAYGPSMIDVDVPANAPDLLIMTRAEHPNVAAGCLGLFLEWKKAGKNAELHMYGDGQSGFGLADRRGRNTTDSWIDDLMTWLAARGYCQQTSNFITVEDGGSGRYKAVADRSAEAPDYTIYRPKNLDWAVEKEGPLPLVIFANGGCSFASNGYENFLSEIASHGYIVAAVGSFSELPNAEVSALGMTDTEYLVHALDVMEALNKNPKSVFYGKVDMKNIAAMGQSCGGGQALTASIVDKRITSTVVLNSGFVDQKPPFAIVEPGSQRPANGPKDGFARSVGEGGKYGKEFGGTMRRADLVNLHNPVVFLIGGPTDVAYPNANANYEVINHVPVFLCNLPVGHMATYAQRHGGAFADVAVKWLEWQLRGREDQKAFFTDDAFKAEKYPEWDVRRKNF